MLGDHAIKLALKDGRIVIDPYDEKQLGPNSYDLRIGEWICRQKNSGLDGSWRTGMSSPSTIGGGESHAPPYQVSTVHLGSPVNGEQLWGSPEKVLGGIIRVRPGELILAHTEEFVGCFENIVGEMASRSTLMRMGIAICVDAGLGDVGFASKWTMEVYNHTRSIITIDVGDRVAQMKFHEVTGNQMSYKEKGGVYGVKEGWDPMDMIPRSHMK